MKSGLYLGTALVAIAALGVATPSRAQQAAPVAPGQADEPPTTAAAVQDGDIVVTAQKRSENIQDVPKQVSVASQAALSTAGVSRINDLAAVLPSLSVANNLQNAKPPGIRGVVTFANAVSVQAQTGIIIDDIPQPTFSTLANELSDVERIEVFPGPQSTLSGRNAAGGIINFVTRAPSQTAQGDFRIEQTTDRQTRTSAFITGPLGPTVAASLSGVFNKWDGPVRNILLDNRAGGFNSKSVRGKLRWDATPDLTATLTGYYLYSKRQTTPIVGGGVYINVAPGATQALDAQRPPRSFEQLYPGITPSADNREFYSFQNGRATTEDYGASLRLDYDVGTLGTISSLSNYSKSEQPRTDVFLGAPQRNVTVTGFNAVTNVDTRYISQEIRLVSPGTQRFTYLLGAIYTDSDVFQPYSRRLIFPFDADRTSRIKGGAVFGRGTFNVTDQDALTGGLRYQHDQSGYTWRFNINPPQPYGAFSEDTSDYGFLAGEVSYKHEFSSSLNVYGTFSHSQTGQAYDVEDTGTVANGPLAPLASEKVDNYEVGFKSQFLDRRLTFNVSAYRADYTNYQIQTVDNSDTTMAPVIRIRAIGAVRTQGVELNATFRTTSGLRLGVAGIVNDAKIRDYPAAGCYTRQTVAQGCLAATATAPANQGNLRGRRLQSAPLFKINANVDYTLPFEVFDVAFDVGGTYRHESSSNFSILHDPQTIQRAFDIVNVYVGAKTGNGKYTAQLFVNNVFNKVFYNNIGNEGLIDARSVLYDRNSFRYSGVRFGASF